MSMEAGSGHTAFDLINMRNYPRQQGQDEPLIINLIVCVEVS